MATRVKNKGKAVELRLRKDGFYTPVRTKQTRRKTRETVTREGDVRLRTAVSAAFRQKKFRTLADGRLERIFTADDWCRPEDVREWLIGQRAVEARDALEHVSRAVWKFLFDNGYLRKDSVNAYYWITAAAAEKYNLPQVMGRPFPK